MGNPIVPSPFTGGYRVRPKHDILTTPFRNCRYYEVTVIEGPKYPGPKQRSIIFGCKFNPHRNTLRFLKALFARISRADAPDPAPDAF